MLPIFLSVLMILIFSISGLLCFKLIRLDRGLLSNLGFSVFIPLLGAISMTCVIQILSLVLPVKATALILIVLLIYALLFIIRDVSLIWLRTMFSDKFLLLIIFIAIVILQFPILFKNELLSLQNGNNDIAYYLSSMDWLKSHRFTESIPFSSEMPFNSLAHYMVNNTRIGTDLLGAFFMSVFQLDSHEVYYLLTGTLATLTIFSAYFFLSYCLNVSRKASLCAAAIFAAGGLWAFLVFSQYAPQIFGITCLISFTGLFIRLDRQKQHKGFVFLSALFLVGTLSVYSEYAIYLLFIFIAIAVSKYITASSETRIKILIDSLKVGALSFILNPVGMFIAAKFNINILTRVLDDASSIDPYSGNLMSKDQIMSILYGGPNLESLGHELNLLGINSQYFITGYTILKFLLLLVFISAVFIGMFLKKEWYKYAILSVFIFFAANELYLRSSASAYAEMKHITTIAPFIILFFVYFADGWKLNVKGLYIRKIIFGTTVIFVAGSNIVTAYQNYKGGDIYYFDHSVMELKDAVKLVPPDEPIGITSSSPADKHSIVYALKEVPIKHNKTYEFDNSYFGFLVPHEFENTKYSIVSKQDYYSFLSQTEEVLWHNDKYVLLHAPTAAIRPISGLYNLEQDGIGYFRWTSSNESELSVFNGSDNKQTLSISLQTESGIFSSRPIKVYANGNLIGQGMSSNVIETETINLLPNESLSITVISEGDLNTVDTGDNRKFGFILRHLDVDLK
ncbi:hypothetical protein SAMN04488601_10518 [Paenibacillus sp. 453mf]|nr:hypothetical protein SAMN04488601_10518 [Paenibacillus sp. 453mf]